MWIAEYDSSHFSFVAVGEQRVRAIYALKRGLRKHGEEYGCDPHWWDNDGINTYQIQMGECLRDGSVIK